MLINANTQALFSTSALKSVDQAMSTAMERLSSGKQVNSAGDNPAGLAMSTLLSADIQAIGQSVRNVNDAISLIQTAEGATQEITNMLQRMRELAVQAVNDTNSEADRSYLNLEFQQLKQEIVRITEMTEWNGFKVLDGSAGVQLGEIPVYKVVSHGLSGETLLSDERVQVIEGETAGETQQWAFTGQPQFGVLRIADAEITLTEDEANTDLSTFVETIATKLRQTDNFNDSSGRDITVSGSSLLVTYPVADGQQDLAELTPSSEDFSMVATVVSEAMISAEEFFSNQMTFRSAGLLAIEIDEASDTPSASFTLPDGEVIQLVGTLDRSAGLVTFVKSDGDNQRLFVSDADSDTLSYAFRDADNGAVSLSGRAVSLNVGVEGAIPGLRAGDLQINGVEVGRSFAGDDLVSPRNNASGSGITKAAAINRVSLETGVYARVNTTLMPGQAMSDTTAVTGVITINGVRTGDIESIAYDSAATRRQVIDAVNAISHRTGVKAAHLGDDETGITLLAEDGRNIEVAFVTPFNKSVFGRGIGLREGVQASTISLESKIPQPVQLTSSITGDISRIGFREGDFSLNQTHYHTADRPVSLPPQAQVDGIQLGSEMAPGDTFSVIVNGTQFTSDDSYELIQDARDDLIAKINNDFTLGVTAKAGRTQDEILLEAQVAGVPFSASASDTSWTTVFPTYKLVDSNGDGISDYLEFSALGVDTETLTIPDDGVPSTVLNELSYVGGVLYRGDGAKAVGIGRIDATNNGELGMPLRINFENIIDGASLIKSPVTGHYYEVVDTGGMTWSDAQEMASNRTLYGLTGYLATVTTSEENEALKAELDKREAWIGASDAAVEGEWRWVTGPEAGELFWLGNKDGSPIDSRFNDWTRGFEPNDFGGEDYAYYTSVGTWNDYPEDRDNNIQSFIVEYGGLNNEVEVLPSLSSLESDLLLSRLIYTNTGESQGNFSSLGRASRFSVQQNELPVQSTLGENDLVINGVKIRPATNSDDSVSSIIPKSSSQAASAIATANAINSHSHQTGVHAEPIGPVSKGLSTDTSLVPSTTNSSVQTLYLNGVAVDVDFVRDEPEDSRREKVVRAINERFGTHGVTATNNSQGVTLTTDGRNLSVWFDSDISGLSAAHFGLAGSDAVAQVSTINFDTVVTEVEPVYPLVEEGVDYIEYSDGGRASETLSIQETTPPDITSGAISFSNGILYRGTGTSAEIVGRIDSVSNGIAGAPLRINYGYEFTNGGLDGPLTGGPTVYSLDGWTIYNEQVRLDGLSQIAGWPTPLDSNDPIGRFGGRPPDSDTSTVSSWVGAVTSLNSDPSSGGGNYLELTTGEFDTQGFGVIHGPYMVSDTSTVLSAGDVVTFEWQAKDSGDDYDVFGYLLNIDTGATIELLNDSNGNTFGRPETPPWSTVTKVIPTSGNYKFIFIGGSFDYSGGTALGAKLQIDSISISGSPPSFTAEQIESIASQVSYIDTSPPEPDPSSQVFTVSINGVALISDSVSSAQEGAENLASKIREKISAGEIKNIEVEVQGEDIIVRSTVAGTPFDIGGVSIAGEGQTTMSVGTQTPNELDTGIVTGIAGANENSDSARTAYGTVRLTASPGSVGDASDTKAPTLIHIEAGLNGYTREGDFIGLGFEEGIFGGRSSQEMDPPRVGRLTFQVGSRDEEQLTIDIPDIGPRGAVTGRITQDSRLSASDQTIRLDSRESASEVLDYLDEAMFEVDRFRGHLGANSSRLSNIIDNLQTTTFNRESSRSQIMDADYARESTELIKSQLLQQASTATLAQANASQKFVLDMLRG